MDSTSTPATTATATCECWKHAHSEHGAVFCDACQSVLLGEDRARWRKLEAKHIAAEAKKQPFMRDQYRPAAATPGASPVGTILSEDALAESYLTLHGADRRYVPELHRWMRWVPAHGWQADAGAFVTREIQSIGHREFVRQSADGKIVPDPKTGGRWTTACGATHTVAATPAIVTPANRWDTGKNLIGLPRCRVLDVVNGALVERDRRREDLISRRLAADPATVEAWTNGAWADHLLTLFDDPELTIYLQRLMGYALLNRGSEDVIVMAHGPRATGKTVTFNAIVRAAGDYGETIDPGAIASAKGFPEHPTNRTAFYGRRIVVSPELEAGARLDAAFVKRLSGGDRLAVRGMRQDETRFTFGGVLVIHTNHQPELLTPDDGLKRRMRVFPFNRERPNPNPDFDLLIDPSHVVSWLLDGLRDYLTYGLGDVPQIIARASAEFHQKADRVSAFAHESLTLAPGERTRAAEVYSVYKEWCDGGGERPLGRRTLNKRLVEGGFGISKDELGGVTFLVGCQV